MKNTINKILGTIAVFLIISPVLANDLGLEKARKNITEQFVDIKPENINKSPIPGLYQVSMPPRFFYASEDGRYLVDGNLIDMTTKENITKGARNKSISTAINSMGESSMLVFGKKTLKHTITVFTDIDCGYCRKLHNEVSKYNKAGIRVRYMAYPRAGIGSDAFKKAEAVWCSKDRNSALTKAKNGINVESKKCKSPVAEQFSLGNMIGIRGTPAIILEDGSVIPGYIPAARLSDALNKAVK